MSHMENILTSRYNDSESRGQILTARAEEDDYGIGYRNNTFTPIFLLKMEFVPSKIC